MRSGCRACGCPSGCARRCGPSARWHGPTSRATASATCSSARRRPTRSAPAGGWARSSTPGCATAAMPRPGCGARSTRPPRASTGPGRRSRWRPRPRTTGSTGSRATAARWRSPRPDASRAGPAIAPRGRSTLRAARAGSASGWGGGWPGSPGARPRPRPSRRSRSAARPPRSPARRRCGYGPAARPRRRWRSARRRACGCRGRCAGAASGWRCSSVPGRAPRRARAVGIGRISGAGVPSVRVPRAGTLDARAPTSSSARAPRRTAAPAGWGCAWTGRWPTWTPDAR